jgi:hypothetical protein
MDIVSGQIFALQLKSGTAVQRPVDTGRRTDIKPPAYLHTAINVAPGGTTGSPLRKSIADAYSKKDTKGYDGFHLYKTLNVKKYCMNHFHGRCNEGSDYVDINK